jgi:acetyl-CoA acetyltransferase
VSGSARGAIVGVGRTAVDRNPASDPMGHLARALKAAVDDAGLTAADIDGVMVNTAPEQGSMDKLPEFLGLTNVQWAFQSWFHGRIQPTCIAVAAMAATAGQARYIACFSTGQRLAVYRERFSGRGGVANPEAHREGGGPHLESPPYGLVSAGGGAAMAMRKYMDKYGGTDEQLAQVAVAQRQWAQLQPEAYFHGTPATLEDYMASPYIVEPLRVLDHCIPGNCGFCIIVTSAERADETRSPVYIRGMQGSASGREHFIFARTGLGIGQQTEAPYSAPDMPVYRQSGVGPADVDILGALDAFSPVVLFILEEFGFCGEGEALEWIQGGRTAPGGELPVNTCGGGLSDIESYGWGHQVDMVRQLRREAGPAQIEGVEVCQYASLDRASLILAR